MSYSVQVCYDTEEESFDYELKLPDYEFDELIEIMQKKHNISYDFPENLVFFTEVNQVKYKLTRDNGNIINN